MLIEKQKNVFSLWSPTPFKAKAGQSSLNIPSLDHINAEMYPIAWTFSLMIKWETRQKNASISTCHCDLVIPQISQANLNVYHQNELQNGAPTTVMSYS